MTNEKIPIDALKAHYLKIKERAMNEEDIRLAFNKETVMQIYMKGTRQKLQKGECTSTLIKAQTTKGKSTLAMFLMLLQNKLIKDMNLITSYKKEEELFGYISANQIEFTRVARRKDLYNIFTVIDEFSHLGNTGAQATIEQSLFKWRANVCAQKFIHTIMCTPTSEYDDHALIILEIIDKDTQKKTILCKLYYNDPTDTRPYYLGNLMFNIEEVLNKKWYQLYRIKKFFTIELVEKDMIRDVRELEEALIVLLTYIQCKDLAEIGHSDRNLTKCKVRDSAREVGAVYSIVGEEIAYKWAQSMIDLVTTKHDLYVQLNKNRKTPLTTFEITQIKNKIDIYNQHIKKEYQKYVSLIRMYVKYMSIGNNKIGEELKEKCKKYDIELGNINPEEDIKRICKKYNLKEPTKVENNEKKENKN